VIQDHSSIGDDKKIKKIFEKYSYVAKEKGGGDEDDSQRSGNGQKELTEENAYMAT